MILFPYPKASCWLVLVLAASFWFVDLSTAAPSDFLSDASLGTVPGTQSPYAAGNLNEIKPAAILTLGEILGKYWGAAGNENIQATPHPVFVDKNGDMHIRARQYLSDGIPIDGATMMIHLHPNGTVFAVNGEFTPDDLVDTPEPVIACEDAMEVALVQSEIVNGTWITDCELAAVQGRDDLAHMAYKRMVGWQILEDAPDQSAFLYASVVNGDLLALHPRTYGARALETFDCQNTMGSGCVLASNSSDPITTNVSAVNDAHNHAIMMYDYLFEQFGRDSVDNNGLTLTSLVRYGKNYANAAWMSGSNFMLYGDGDGVTTTYFSRSLDIVAHEFAHGVTLSESNLIYYLESGAINEAFSDIIGAAVERIKGGKSEDMTWELGEDVFLSTNFTAGGRNMADPQKYKDFDFYIDRYRGTLDNGGVHVNSGIMNLAFALMVKGGYHPRKKTTIKVPRINDDFDTSMLAAAAIFYYANLGCLTESSDFRAARECTVMFAGDAIKSVEAAWDAVGVRPIIDIYDGVPLTNQTLYKGGVQEYRLGNVKGGYRLTCNATGIDGDPDLYVRFGDHPEPFPYSTLNDCTSDLGSTPSPWCRVEEPHLKKEMTAFVMLKAIKKYSNVTLECHTSANKKCRIPGDTCQYHRDCCNPLEGPPTLTCDGPVKNNKKKMTCKKCKGLKSKCLRTSECCQGYMCKNQVCT